jgi:hypothetical protein
VTSNLEWTKLAKMFQSQDVVAKMYLKDKFHTLKMRKSCSVTKHIHLFQTNLHQLTNTSVAILDDKTIICFIRNMPPNYKILKISLKKQLNSSIFYHRFDPRKNLDEGNEYK